MGAAEQEAAGISSQGGGWVTRRVNLKPLWQRSDLSDGSDKSIWLVLTFSHEEHASDQPKTTSRIYSFFLVSSLSKAKDDQKSSGSSRNLALSPPFNQMVDCPSHIRDWGRGQHQRDSLSVFSENIVYYLEVVGVPTVEDGSEWRRNWGLLDKIERHMKDAEALG